MCFFTFSCCHLYVFALLWLVSQRESERCYYVYFIHMTPLRFIRFVALLPPPAETESVKSRSSRQQNGSVWNIQHVKDLPDSHDTPASSPQQQQCGISRYCIVDFRICCYYAQVEASSCISSVRRNKMEKRKKGSREHTKEYNFFSHFTLLPISRSCFRVQQSRWEKSWRAFKINSRIRSILICYTSYFSVNNALKVRIKQWKPTKDAKAPSLNYIKD